VQSAFSLAGRLVAPVLLIFTFLVAGHLLQ